jgi:hypothetical protein
MALIPAAVGVAIDAIAFKSGGARLAATLELPAAGIAAAAEPDAVLMNWIDPLVAVDAGMTAAVPPKFCRSPPDPTPP